MDNNWIVENLTNAFSVWNTKMTEMWSLLMESPQDFKGGTIWQTIAKLETLQTADDYDSISVDGQAADWVEVLAVFAVKVAGSDDVDAADVVTMDADRIARLRDVFWDMTTIAHRVEVIHHPSGGEEDNGWTERKLYITITAKTAEEMKTVYHFNRNQIAALEELLEQRDLLLELVEDVLHQRGYGGVDPQSAGRSITGA